MMLGKEEQYLSLNSLANETIMHVFDIARQALVQDQGDACELGFALRLVSRRFNGIVNAMTPSLWSSIHIGWEHGHEQAEYVRLRSCLAASEPTELLRIRLRAPISDYSIAEDAEHHGKRFFEALLPIVSRIEALDVDFRCVDKLDTFCNIFKHVPVPKLQFLRLSLDQEPYITRDGRTIDDEFFGQNMFRGVDHIPLLDELVLEGFGIDRLGLGPATGTPVNFRTVKVVSNDSKYLNVWQWEYFRMDLTDMPLLENLTVCFDQNPFVEFWHPELDKENAEKPITCSKLLSLHLNEHTQSLLQLVQAPQLQSLTLTNGDLQAVTWYLSVCNDIIFPRLQTIHLIHTADLDESELAPDECAQLIRHTPAISHLIVEANAQPRVHQDLIYHLAINRGQHSWPALSHIEATYISRSMVLAFIIDKNRPAMTRIAASKILEPHYSHVHPEVLGREAAKGSTELIMPSETCKECWDQACQ